MSPESDQHRNQDASCDFCGHPEAKVGPIAEGVALMKLGRKADVSHICPGCAAIIVSVTKQRQGYADMIPSPRKVLTHLDDFIIGQDRAKKVLSVAVVNHLKRLRAADGGLDGTEMKGVPIGKSNVLLIGSTGVGKTALVRALAKALDVPLAIGDATSLTEAGYVGEDVENLILKFVQAADYDIELAQRGIVYIDEIDKLRRSSHNASITRPVGGEGVQQALLKLIEGTVASVPVNGGRKHPEQQYIQVDTSQILFIAGGSFEGLEEIIARRLGRGRIGFGGLPEDRENDRDHLLAHVTPEDLERFGLIPELAGRLPVIATLDALTEDDLIRILTEPKDALIRQYRALFALDRAKLLFTQSAVKEIAGRAKALGTGARGLRTILEELLLDLQFSLPDLKPGQTIIISEEMVRGEKPFPVAHKVSRRRRGRGTRDWSEEIGTGV